MCPELTTKGECLTPIAVPGMLRCITCKDIGTFFQNGDTAAVDLITGTITNETAGTSVQAEPLSDYVMDILQHGGIKPLIRARLGKGAL